MQKEFSIYLDALRIFAASLVVLLHTDLRYLTPGHPLNTLGHEAVVIFFVLSGFVISYITSTRERTPIDYWSSRIARFYPLVIPTILLTPVLDMVGQQFGPQFYADGKTTEGGALLRMGISMFFMNQSWNQAVMLFSNIPFWSLCYEMWYYVLFAIAFFCTGRRRVLLLLGACLVIGPKILLLFPVWLLGVWIHRDKRLERLGEPVYWILFIASVLAFIWFCDVRMTQVGKGISKEMLGPKYFELIAHSRYFVTDYLLGIIVAANFIGFRGIGHRFALPFKILEKPIRWAATFTFPLYLLHQPLVQFYGALINGDPSTYRFFFEVLGATVLTVIVIGTLAERTRYRTRGWIKARLEALAAAWQGFRSRGALAG